MNIDGKKYLALLAAVAIAVGLAACGRLGGGAPAGETQNESESEAPVDGDTITVWAWDESFYVKAANAAKEQYEKENPGVRVEVVEMAQKSIEANLNKGLFPEPQGDGSLPDIVLLDDYRAQNYLDAYQEDFSDLSDIAKPEDFVEYKSVAVQKDGKMYGIPFDSGVSALFYRTDYIEKAGYTAADMENLTWDKFIEIGKAVKDKTRKDMLALDPNDIWQIRMMLQSAGTWYTDQYGEADIKDNQALREALGTYKRIVDAGIYKEVQNMGQYTGAFNTGEVATVAANCRVAPYIMKSGYQKGKWAVAAFPRLSEYEGSVNASAIGGAGWYVLKKNGHEQAAKDFLKSTFASDIELLNGLSAEIGLVSALKDAGNAPYYSEELEFFGGQKVYGDFAKWTAQVPPINYGKHTLGLEDIMKKILGEYLDGAVLDETIDSYKEQIHSTSAW